MVLRTREEALAALAHILTLDRQAQLVEVTVQLAQCVSPEARRILFHAQEGLIHGNLEARLKEHVAPGKPEGTPRRRAADNDKLREEIGAALEALKFAAVVFDVFPELRFMFERWEVARAAQFYSDDLKRLVKEGTSVRRAPAARSELTALVARFRPWWHAEVSGIGQVCERVLQSEKRTRWAVGPKTLLDVVATTELRAMYASKNNIPTQQAMVEPLADVYRALQRALEKHYPAGLPEDSALAR